MRPHKVLEFRAANFKVSCEIGPNFCRKAANLSGSVKPCSMTAVVTHVDGIGIPVPKYCIALSTYLSFVIQYLEEWDMVRFLQEGYQLLLSLVAVSSQSDAEKELRHEMLIGFPTHLTQNSDSEDDNSQ